MLVCSSQHVGHVEGACHLCVPQQWLCNLHARQGTGECVCLRSHPQVNVFTFTTTRRFTAHLSSHSVLQYNGDGIAARGVAYGMHTMRVDGNDVWAVLEATKRAREIASGSDGSGTTKPVLIECMTYREGHHSTSDDSTRYRTMEEIKHWKETSNPIMRLRKYLERRGWWNQDMENALVASERKAVLTAMTNAERKSKPDFKVRRRHQSALRLAAMILQHSCLFCSQTFTALQCI